MDGGDGFGLVFAIWLGGACLAFGFPWLVSNRGVHRSTLFFGDIVAMGVRLASRSGQEQ